MARGKKKETTLTPEEKMAQALVPDWEQPYKVPRNWSWVRLGSFSTNQYGYTAKAIEDKSLPKMLRITDIQDSGVDWSSVPNCEINKADLEKYLLRPNDIVIARIGATTGKSFLLENPTNSVFASYLIRLRPFDCFIPAYVYYFLQSDAYWKQISELSSGLALPGVNSSKLQTMMFPSAPKAEQQRIVDRIEYLFAKLDETKEKAQSVLDSFETRKAAILHKAFTGELTVKWRAEHGIGMDTWKHHTFRELCTDIVRGGSPRPAGSPEFYDGPIPFMKVADITRNNSPYVSSAEYSIKEAGLKKTRMVSANTLLLTNSGATLGVPAICTFETTFNDGIAAFLGLPEDTLLFYYYFWTSKTSDLRAINKGAAQPNLNTTIIGDVEIDIPSDPEKYEIVRILESLFMKEEQAKEAAEAVLEKIDLLKKSILARAFRGELGTNNPTEESALELLKRII